MVFRALPRVIGTRAAGRFAAPAARWVAADASRSVDPAEVARFRQLTARWWDTSGPMAELHKMNPVRLRWLADFVSREGIAAGTAAQPLAGLRVLDIGCGAGIASEGLARMGANVLGVDACQEAIDVASQRLEGPSADLQDRLQYRCTTAEDVASESPGAYDVVTAFELIEHVTSHEVLLDSMAKLVRPEGALCLSTLNKTMLSYGLAIALAQNVLCMVPPETHQWDKFVAPETLKGHLSKRGVVVAEVKGMCPVPTLLPTPGMQWELCSDSSVNYLMGSVRLTEEPAATKTENEAPDGSTSEAS